MFVYYAKKINSSMKIIVSPAPDSTIEVQQIFFTISEFPTKYRAPEYSNKTIAPIPNTKSFKIIHQFGQRVEGKSFF
jgi:hypothetical protein